jgi:hypothetical protein
MNKLKTARAPNIKHDSPEVKDVCYAAERVSRMLDVKINRLRVAMQKSDNLPKSDMFTIRIRALEWVQAQCRI